MSEKSSLSLQAVSKIAVAAQATDVQLIMGATRYSFGANGEFDNAPTVDYFAGYSLSPTTAKQLLGALDTAIREYEKMFGAIPVDPGQSPDLNSKTAK